MRYGRWAIILHPLGPSTGGQWPLPIRHEPRQLTHIVWAPRPELRRLYRIDHHRKNEPGVPKGWEDYHTGEGSHCPWGHPHKFQFIKRLSHNEFVWPCIGCLMRKPADSSALIPLDFSSGFVYNSHDNQIGQFVTILSVNKTRDLQSDGRICAHFVLLWARTAPIFLFLEE